jgi:hypothetical protein
MATIPVSEQTPEGDTADFSLVREGPLHDIQRAAHLIPAGRFGVFRRMAVVIAIGWLPLVLWALWNRRAIESGAIEPLLQHFGVHARFLVAVPLLLLAEPVAEAVGRRIVSYFVTSGLVPPAERPAFLEILRHGRRLLRSRWALAAIAAIVAALAVSGAAASRHPHELQWAVTADGAGEHATFASWWFLWVSLPLYQVLLFAWLWRVAVATRLLWRISRLDLELVATHPDRCGGLGFLEALPNAFALVIAATAAVLSARWGHDVLYHGTPLASLRLPLAVYLGLVLVISLGPLLVFVPRLAALKRKSLLTYGALVGRHGRLVERRWLRGEPIDDDALLNAPELGPVADTLALYQAVANLRPAPIGKRSIITAAAAAVLPMIPMAAMQVPLKDQLLGLIKILL